MTTTLNAQYVLPNTNQQKYPALQADNYQPKSLKTEINLCLAEESVDLLSPETIEKLSLEITPVNFGEDDINVFVPKSQLEYVILGMPRLDLYNKESKRYEALVSGTKLAGTKKVTAAKLFMCVTIAGDLLLDNDGKPQIFTLNLKSSRTGLLKAQSPTAGDGTLHSLNTALNKHYQVNGWVTHLVSVKLLAVPEKFTSSVSGDSSLGIKFALQDAATLLTEANQKAMFELLQAPDLQADMDNPFKLDLVAPDFAPSDYATPIYGDDIHF